MERVIARKLANSYLKELSPEELALVAGGTGTAGDIQITPAGPTALEGGGQVKDPRRVDEA